MKVDDTLYVTIQMLSACQVEAKYHVQDAVKDLVLCSETLACVF